MRELSKNFPWMTVALLVLVGGFGFFTTYIKPNLSFDKSDQSVGMIDENSPVQPTPRRLDGVIVEKGKENLTPVAIMIENHINARPPAALSKALIVYEALTEYNITRFLAIYDLSEDLEKIGPIRSARSYFIDLAHEYNAVYVHSGGSPEALDTLKGDESGVYDLNEFFGYNTNYFRRDATRYRPHNLYSSSDRLTEAIFDSGWSKTGDFLAWEFKDETNPVYDSMEINLPYSDTSYYHVTWRYDKENNFYKRWQNKQPHVDAGGDTVTAKNIVIQYIETAVVDSVGRREMDLESGGAATIFQDGRIIEGRWEKRDGRTFFYDQNGQDIKFNRGTTWIELMPTSMEVMY